MSSASVSAAAAGASIARYASSNRRRSAGPDQPAGSAPGSADRPSIINAASDRRSWRACSR
ncbi:hypothetical protein [Streptomyces griseofuscus]|uniref:hypothetical protein n=1 Tax=Streptomyces griseofuscus TaxID=146922 RepID=UPI00155A5813|nr:hypothetical protein [Streptomyces griseofuscus]